MASDTGLSRQAPRWMKITLALSLGLNLLIAGVILGAVTFASPGALRGDDRNGVVGALVRALPEASQRDLRRALRQERPMLRDSRRKVQAARREMLVALRAEPFDRSRFEAALIAQREVGEAFVSTGQDLLVRQVQGMTAQERKAYATRLEEMARRRPPRQ